MSSCCVLVTWELLGDIIWLGEVEVGVWDVEDGERVSVDGEGEGEDIEEEEEEEEDLKEMELDSEVLDRGNGEVLEVYFCLVL